MRALVPRFLSVILLLGFAGCATEAPQRPWVPQVDTELRAMGYRNWVVIADASFPVHSRRGVRTIIVDDEIPAVLDEVLQSLDRVQNVTPRIYLARELGHVPNDRAPGVNHYRETLDQALRGFPTREMEYRWLSLMLEDNSNKFVVLVLKTKTALPYSSVFIELDSAYWDGESERDLRERMESERLKTST